MQWKNFLEKENEKQWRLLTALKHKPRSLKELAAALDSHPKTVKRLLFRVEKTITFVHFYKNNDGYAVRYTEGFTWRDAELLLFSTSQQFSCLRRVMWGEGMSRYEIQREQAYQLNQKLTDYQLTISIAKNQLIGAEQAIRLFMLKFCKAFPEFTPLMRQASHTMILEDAIAEEYNNYDELSNCLFFVMNHRQRQEFPILLHPLAKLFACNNPFFYTMSQDLASNYFLTEQLYFYLVLIAEGGKWKRHTCCKSTLSFAEEYLQSSWIQRIVSVFCAEFPELRRCKKMDQLKVVIGQQLAKELVFGHSSKESYAFNEAVYQQYPVLLKKLTVLAQNLKKESPFFHLAQHELLRICYETVIQLLPITKIESVVYIALIDKLYADSTIEKVLHKEFDQLYPIRVYRCEPQSIPYYTNIAVVTNSLCCSAPKHTSVVYFSDAGEDTFIKDISTVLEKHTPYS